MTDQLIIDQAADVSHLEPDYHGDSVRVEPMNPLMLIERAVDKGMDPAQLKALVDLHEQWKAARAKEAFAAAMNAVQAEMPCVVRDAQNSQTNSRYVRFETVTHLAKPIYTGHGFSLSFSEDESGIEKFKRIVCLVRHNEGHSERHWIDLPLDGFGAKGNPIGQMNPVQAAISTGSYGQRVLTCRVFNITIADTDLDGSSPLAPNPEADPEAPRAAPRGKRDQPAPTEVSKDECAELYAQWQTSHPQDFDPVVEHVRERWAAWVAHIVKREFPVMRVASWKRDEYLAVRKALKLDE